MSESSSGVNMSRRTRSKTQPSPWSDLSDRSNPQAVPCGRRDTLQQHSDSGIASPLPSGKFKFKIWHEIEGNNIKGTQLHSPRVREGPPPGDLFPKDGKRSALVKKESRDEEAMKQRRLENWENCLEVNLSYQGLGDPYQLENLYKILRRLIRVEKLQLADNFLTDLSSVRLPRCKELNLNKNYLSSFQQLPKIPQIQHLSLTENNITTLSGLHDLGPSPIKSLTLKRNPCEFQDNYRCRVFSSLPNLKTLDGIPKLPADCYRPETPVKSKMCTVS
ncbi:uncharacterized protein LOC116980161 [Amblyraja radiata]|uniref:uncharacterized protein LOC116980161 n=1 Tax=Amblyraja radiata TaxID=386614 RepID=UPI0014036986|nr:uncharacterized protein LOC116980161 [Amblyraja radiata]